MKSVIYLYQLAADRVSAAPSLLWVRAIKTLDWWGIIHFIAALAFSARRLVQQQDNKTDRSKRRKTLRRRRNRRTFFEKFHAASRLLLRFCNCESRVSAAC